MRWLVSTCPRKSVFAESLPHLIADARVEEKVPGRRLENSDDKSSHTVQKWFLLNHTMTFRDLWSRKELCDWTWTLLWGENPFLPRCEHTPLVLWSQSGRRTFTWRFTSFTSERNWTFRREGCSSWDRHHEHRDQVITLSRRCPKNRFAFHNLNGGNLLWCLT